MKENASQTHSRRRDIALGGAGFLGAFLLILAWPRSPHVQQPIQYNHQKHLDAGMECSNCHTLYSTTPWAGLPTIEMCSLCHQEPSTGTAAEAQVVEFVQKGENPRWQQVNQLPTHVYFSHQTHTGSARIECVACHGEMQKRTTPPTQPLFAWTMAVCLDCHAQRGATQDCDGCHR